MASPLVVNHQVLRPYASSGSTSFTMSGRNAQVGDLAVLHHCNGNSATGSGEVVSGDGNWTKLGTTNNGRSIHYKTLTSADLSATHSISNQSTNWGMMLMIFRSAKLNTTLSGFYTPGGPAGPATKDSVGVKVSYNPSNAGDFPNINNSDSAQVYHWKNFTSGQTYATWPNASTAWHSGNSNYAVYIIEEEIPNTKPALSNLYSSSINPLVDSKLTWTYSDPESNPQVSYQIGWRKQGSGENHNFYEYQSANPYHTIPAGTLEEGVTYDWAVRVKDSNGLWSDYATSQFTSISPYRIETAVNLSSETPNFGPLGSATVTNNYSWGGSSWNRIQPLANGHGGRHYVPLAHLKNGETYTVSMTLANPTASAGTFNIDWCDSTGLNPSVAAGETKRVSFNATRSSYNDTYRFVDVTGTVGMDILVKDIMVSPGASKSQHFFNGDTADTPSTTYRWLGAPGASPSVKEVFALTNKVPNPKPIGTGDFTGNGSWVIEGDAMKYTTPAAGTISSFQPTEVGNLVPGYKGDRVEARFLYKGPGDRNVIWHVCDSAGNIVQQHVTTLPSSPSAYTEVVCAGTNTTDNAMSVRFVQLCYGSGATGASAPHYFKNIIVHETNRTGPYFDGSLTNSGLGLYQWTGATNDSSSTKVTSSGVLKNIIPGDAEAQSAWNVGGWNWSGAVINTGGFSGGKFQRLTATAATQTAGMYLAGIWGVEAGQQYTLTCKMRASAAGTTWQIAPEWRRLDGTLVSNQGSGAVALAANTWTEVGSVMTAPEGAYGVTFCMYKNTGNLPSGGYIDIDEPFMALSRDGVKLNYFDGNTTDTSTYQYNWEGAAGTSTSIRSGGFWTETPERVYNQIVNPSAIGGTTGIRNSPSFNPANLAISSVAATALEGVTTALNVSVTAGDSGWGHFVSYNTIENLPAGTKGKLRFQARGVSGSYSTIGWAITNDPATATVASFSSVTLTSSWQLFEQSFTLSGAMTAGSQFARFVVGNGNLTQVIQVTGVELIPETTIDAGNLTEGDYEVQALAQDADGVWGVWGAPETFTLGPASNLLVKSGGTFATGLRLVKQGGVWVETGVTKQFTEKYSDAIIASAPVGYWRLDDTSGTQATDYSGAGRHGTYVNGVSLNQDGPNKTMRSALFTRASSQHVTLPTSGLPSGNSNYSFEFWFNPTVIDELQGIVNIGSYGTQNQGNAVRLTSTGGSGIHNYWWNLDATYNSTNIAINQWHHGVWTYDGANRRFYLNGVLVRTVASSNAAIVIGVPTIGKTANSEYFNGRLAHVSIYNRALSAAEAADHYAKSGGIY